MSALPPPQPLDVVAWVTVRLHESGMLSTQGTIGDAPMAIHLLEQAIDALRRDAARRAERGLFIPGRDVDVAPSLPVRALGDMASHERGDP
jgi:hypothetical protein